MPGTFPPPPRVTDPDMHHETCVTHVSWCMPGSLTSGFIWSRWREKRSRHYRCMRNLQFYVSGKRPYRVTSPEYANSTIMDIMSTHQVSNTISVLPFTIPYTKNNNIIKHISWFWGIKKYFCFALNGQICLHSISMWMFACINGIKKTLVFIIIHAKILLSWHHDNTHESNR